MMNTLPFEVITIILLMLPAKALVKLQCVCTAWRDLIRDPTFIKKHLQFSASKGNRYLLHKPFETTDHHTFRLHSDKTFDPALEIELPLELMPMTMSFMIVGSFNGLLCLAVASSFGTMAYICNPLIRKYRAINFPIANIRSSSDYRGVGIAYGFGYHDETDDYKIVRIVSTPIEEEDVAENSIGFETLKNTKIEVYSLMENLWYGIEADYFPWELFSCRSDIVLNQSIHWKAVYQDTHEDIMVILAFHLGEEVFRPLGLPNHSSDGQDLIEYVGVYQGNLSLFVFHLLNRDHWDEKCYLWVMREYGVEASWTKIQSVAINPGVIIPRTFTQNNEIVYGNGEDETVVYNFDNNTTRVVIGREEQPVQDLVTYMESLVMLDD